MTKAHDLGHRINYGRLVTRPPARRPHEIRFTPPKPSKLMHIKLGHPEWVRHRMMLDRAMDNSRLIPLSGTQTACEETLDGKYYAVIDAAGFDGVFCTKCFTEAEIRRAAQLMAAELERQRKVDEAWLAEREEHSRQLEQERRAHHEDFARRFPTGETEPVPKIDEEE